MSSKRAKVLVIDDEPQIRRALKVGLENSDYSVRLACNGEEGLDSAALELPDLVILDLVMPGIDGFEVCRQLREWTQIPIIVLSVRNTEPDKVQALDMGADDYVAKPFGMGELLARIRVALRRIRDNEAPNEAVFTCDGLIMDFPRRIVSLDGQELHLTPTEYELLRYMTTHADRVLTHKQIITNVWGEQFCDDHHTLRVYVNSLRNKIERQRERPRFIHTETGVGYRFQTQQRV